MLDLASKALEVIIYWKLLSNTVRAQFQGGSFTKMALGRESNSSSLPFWDLPPEGSPTLNGQNSCLLTVYLSSPTHSYSNLKSGTGLLLLVPFPISAYCPTLNWQWDSPCYLFQSFAGLSKKNWLDSGVTPILGFIFTTWPAGNLTLPFFRLCTSLSSLNPTDPHTHYGELASFFSRSWIPKPIADLCSRPGTFLPTSTTVNEPTQHTPSTPPPNQKTVGYLHVLLLATKGTGLGMGVDRKGDPSSSNTPLYLFIKHASWEC